MVPCGFSIYTTLNYMPILGHHKLIYCLRCCLCGLKTRPSGQPQTKHVVVCVRLPCISCPNLGWVCGCRGKSARPRMSSLDFPGPMRKRPREARRCGSTLSLLMGTRRSPLVPSVPNAPPRSLVLLKAAKTLALKTLTMEKGGGRCPPRSNRP